MYSSFGGYLKQSTASQVRLIGPYVDDTDGKTPETALTIANTDLKLSKNGAATANKNSGGGTHIEQGMYAITFNATDTDTLGTLDCISLVSGARLVTKSWIVITANNYDALFGAGVAKPGQVTPPDVADLATMASHGYKATVNKNDISLSAGYRLYSNDSATVDQKATVTNDGVTLTRGKVSTGP
jgi:hypothetical protein